MKKKKVSNKEFEKVLSQVQIPVLTLDERWHTVFADHEKSQAMCNLEKQLNDTIKLQGKLVTDIKEMRKLKSKLMDQILNNMGTTTGNKEVLRSKKVGKSKELIQDINDKILENEMKISDIPREIKQINYQLMLESMKVCYERMTENTEEIKKLEKWILNARNELKEKLLDKQEREMKNQQIYTYMHDVLGAQAMELFDNQYEEKSEEEEE